jgi:hypothetical protein
MTTTKKTATTKQKTTTTKRKVAAAQPIPDLPNNPFIYEVLDVVSKQRSKAKKIEALQKYKAPVLVTLFVWNFDETVISALPEGDVPYAAIDGESGFKGTLSEKIADAVSKMEELDTRSLGANDQGRTTIRAEFRKFYNFVKGGNDSLSMLRRETMFINILSGLHPLEAEILCLCKDKKLGTKYNLTKEIVAEAYPDIQWGGRS